MSNEPTAANIFWFIVIMGFFFGVPLVAHWLRKPEEKLHMTVDPRTGKPCWIVRKDDE